MYIYELPSQKFQEIFGPSDFLIRTDPSLTKPEKRPKVIIIAHRFDCLAYLLLSKENLNLDKFENVEDIPNLNDYIFNYRQEWGLNVSNDKIRRVLKDLREKEVKSIKVKTKSNKVFDGDEVSQERMARAILNMQLSGKKTIEWTLADNTRTNITLEELQEAFLLANEAQAKLWEIPEKWK